MAVWRRNETHGRGTTGLRTGLAAFAVAAAPILAAALPGPAVAQEGFEACTVPGYDGPARCGTVHVWEDPEVRERRLGLRVVVLEATGPDSLRLPDPVLVLDGGPGQAASRAAEWVARDLEAVLRTRDVILADRRGTGGSNPLDCPGEPGAETPPAEVVAPRTPADARACMEHLRGRADLTKYTTHFAADDAVALADSLGVERLNVYGGSYGSREAFELIRRHPGRIRAVAVFAATPQHRRALLESPRSAETAMRRLLDDCMADRRCRAAYPELPAELDAVVRRLEEEPATFVLPLPDGSSAGPITLDRTAFGTVLRMGLLSPSQSAQLPALIHQAYGGDFAPVGAAFVRIARMTPLALSRGLFLSAVCAEEMARVDPDEIGPATRDTFWGDGWVRSLERECAEWPVGELPAGFHEPPRGDVPVLLMAGWLDPIAPPAWARELTRHLPNARRVVVREGHHSFPFDACAREALARFYDRADPFGLDVSCIAGASRPPFVIPPAHAPGGEVPGRRP